MLLHAIAALSPTHITTIYDSSTVVTPAQQTGCMLLLLLVLQAEADSDSSPEKQQQQQQLPSKTAADRKLAAFLSGRKGNAGLTAAAAPRLSKEQLAAQQRKQEQQRLLERKLKKQFMSSKVQGSTQWAPVSGLKHLSGHLWRQHDSSQTCMHANPGLHMLPPSRAMPKKACYVIHLVLVHTVACTDMLLQLLSCCDNTLAHSVHMPSAGAGCGAPPHPSHTLISRSFLPPSYPPTLQVDKIFDGVQHQQLAAAAAAAAGADEADELTPEQFANMKRDVEQLGEQQQQQHAACSVYVPKKTACRCYMQQQLQGHAGSASLGLLYAAGAAAVSCRAYVARPVMCNCSMQVE
jgi:hypothetical protein